MAAVQIANMLANLRTPNAASPVPVYLPPPPELTGALAQNNVLAKAVKFADNIVSGPESMVVSNGYVYSGLSDGYVVEIRPDGTRRNIRRMSVSSCGRPRAGEAACGRPLGVRENKGFLIVADAYHGIIALNPVNGDFRILVSGNTEVKGKKIGGFINDLTVAKDGSIYFTTSSSKYTRKDYLDVILEGETSGRVLVYNAKFPGRQKVKELVTTLNFPNGLQLSKDESFLLIAEGARCRIHKAYIDRKSSKFGQIETFTENLPGFVDNIRMSPRGTYWVGLSTVRHAGQPSILDQYGNNTAIRATIMRMPREEVLARAPKYGMAVELNEKGQIIRSLHDPTGEKFSAVSEVQEEKDMLYLGSFNNSFVGKIPMRLLPPIHKPPTPGGNPQLEAFLNQIRQRMRNMGPNQVEQVVVSLVQYLVQVKLDAMRAEARAKELEKEVARLQAIVDGIPSTTPQPATAPPASTAPPTSPTTPSPPVSTTPTSQSSTTPTSGSTTPSSGGASTTPAATTPAPTTSPSGGTTGGSTTPAGGGSSASTTPSSATTSPAPASSTTPSSGGDGSSTSLPTSSPTTQAITSPSSGDASSTAAPSTASTTPSGGSTSAGPGSTPSVTTSGSTSSDSSSTTAGSASSTAAASSPLP